MAFSNQVTIFNPAIPTSGVTLDGKVQLTTDFAGAPLALKLYGKADTAFSNSIVSAVATADANGDASFSIDLGSNIQGPGTYVLHVTRTSGIPALTPLTSSDISIGAIGTLVAFLKNQLCAFENIERFEEMAMPNEAFDTFRFGYGNWSSDSPVLAAQDESTITEGSKYKVNYGSGFLQYLTALLDGHDVRASYKFSIFTNAEYQSFFYRALSNANGYKPASNYTFDSMPSQWLDLMVLGAYIRALEAMSLRMGTFKWRRVFDEPNVMAAQISSLLAASKAEWTELIAKTKRRGIMIPLGVSNLSAGGLGFQADGVNWRSFVIGG